MFSTFQSFTFHAFSCCVDAFVSILKRIKKTIDSTKKTVSQFFNPVPEHRCTPCCGIAGCFHKKPNRESYEKMRTLFTEAQDKANTILSNTYCY